MKVIIRYDFNGDESLGELVLRENDVLTVTNDGVDEGWWEGMTQDGKIGLFPQNYCEILTESNEYGTIKSNYFDDSFDSDNETETQDRSSTIPLVETTNRLSMNDIKDNDKLQIIKMEKENDYSWYRSNDSYTVYVQSPKKESKFSGMKTFIAYELISTITKLKVSRRFKHFDWLYKRLKEKYVFIIIPPIPDKQISGRFDEDFVEQRQQQLQNFVDYICRHPILANCDIWINFLISNNLIDWKKSKREAERNPLKGFDLCTALYLPDNLTYCTTNQIETMLKESNQFITNMKSAINNFEAVCSNQISCYQNILKRDYKKLSDGFSLMAVAIEIDEARVKNDKSLIEPCKFTSSKLIQMSNNYFKQQKYDWMPFSSALYLYSGLINTLNQSFDEYRCLHTKSKQLEKSNDPKFSDLAKQTNLRVQQVYFALLTELCHLRNERETFLRESINKFFSEQIKFHKEIINNLNDIMIQF